MAKYSLSNATNLFKIKYDKLSDNVYNSANVVLGRMKKSYDFVGKQIFQPVPTTFSGGVGSGSLPTANYANYSDAIITAKKMYAVIQIEREAIKAAETDEGSFVRMTKHVVQKGVESYMRNMSRALFNDGTALLGVGDGATNVTGAGTVGSPYVVVLQASTFKEANWEEKDFVNYHTETSLLEVSSVDPATYTVELVGTSAGLAALAAGPSPVPTNRGFYMQGSKDNDITGIKGVLDATSGSLYNIAVGRRWKASFQESMSGAGITTDILNQAMLEIQKKCGKVPNLLVTSFAQYRKLLNIIEDQKRYSIDPRAADLKGKISFSGLSFMSAAGEVGIFPERFVEDDRFYLLNDNYMEIKHRPGFGWFDDDGTVFLRDASEDSYSARYGGYMEMYMPPSFHGVITGLAV